MTVQRQCMSVIMVLVRSWFIIFEASSSRNMYGYIVILHNPIEIPWKKNPFVRTCEKRYFSFFKPENYQQRVKIRSSKPEKNNLFAAVFEFSWFWIVIKSKHYCYFLLLSHFSKGLVKKLISVQVKTSLNTMYLQANISNDIFDIYESCFNNRCTCTQFIFPQKN